MPASSRRGIRRSAYIEPSSSSRKRRIDGGSVFRRAVDESGASGAGTLGAASGKSSLSRCEAESSRIEPAREEEGSASSFPTACTDGTVGRSLGRAPGARGVSTSGGSPCGKTSVFRVGGGGFVVAEAWRGRDPFSWWCRTGGASSLQGRVHPTFTSLAQIAAKTPGYGAWRSPHLRRTAVKCAGFAAARGPRSPP